MTNESQRLARRIVTVTGPDRPGLVAAVSRVFADEDVDLEDVSMTRLSGNFTTMLLARGGDESRLRMRLEEIATKFGLHIHLEAAVEHEDEPEPDIYVSASGPNRTGIVAALSQTLASHNVNILEMTTRLLDRTKVPVYMVRIEAAIGAANPDALRADLELIGRELGIEVRLEAVEHQDM
ncbi:MAG: glycine cleavage system protein R [Candidatus Sumerlaeaceae bacterium]